MNSNFNLKFIRKTDESITLTLSKDDLSDFEQGNYIFYLTVRNALPAVALTNDDDSAVILKKTTTIALPAPVASFTAIIGLTKTDLDKQTGKYYYDIKMSNTDNELISITDGFAIFEIVSDITRRTV